MTPHQGHLGIGPLVEHPPFALVTHAFFSPLNQSFASRHNRIRLQHHNTIANRREVCCSNVYTVVNFHLKKVSENRNHEIAIIFAYLVCIPSFLQYLVPTPTYENIVFGLHYLKFENANKAEGGKAFWIFFSLIGCIVRLVIV